jgi:hypothetical protein
LPGAFAARLELWSAEFQVCAEDDLLPSTRRQPTFTRRSLLRFLLSLYLGWNPYWW